MSTGEFAPALERGLVDTGMETIAHIYPTKYWEVGAKYITMAGLWFADSAYYINKDAWNALPPEWQAVITSEMPALEKEAWELGRIAEDELLAIMESEHGVEAVYLPQEDLDEWRELCLPLYEEYFVKAGPESREIQAAIDSLR